MTSPSITLPLIFQGNQLSLPLITVTTLVNNDHPDAPPTKIQTLVSPTSFSDSTSNLEPDQPEKLLAPLPLYNLSSFNTIVSTFPCCMLTPNIPLLTSKNKQTNIYSFSSFVFSIYQNGNCQNFVLFC